jgi:hypothetical protein
VLEPARLGAGDWIALLNRRRTDTLRSDFERRLAIAELLAQSDPPELPRRSHRVRLHGKPERYALLPWLSALFLQQQLQALEERREAHLERVRRNIQWCGRSAFRKDELTPA